MAETTAFADDETALRHGEELVSRLPTLAYYARNTPTGTIRRRRGIINRVDGGDRRRTTTMKVRFTALDRPDYRTTAGIDMGKLLSKGLGRRPESSVILPLASTYDDLKRKANELFPVLDGMAFDLVEGKRGNKFLPLDASTTLGAIRSSNRGAEFARLWVLPDTYISTENATMWPDDRTEPSMDTSPIPDMDTSASLGASSSQVAITPIEAEDRVEDEVSFILRVDEPSEEHSPGYVKAGTPTVLFRRTNSVIDIASGEASDRTTALEDFIAELSTAPNIGETILTEEVRERLKIHSAAVFDRSSDAPFLMEVRRGSALKDAQGLVQISQGDLASPLRIRFIGEEGVDLGGLRREFWSLVVHQFTHSSLVKGKSSRLTFQKNNVEGKKRTYFHLGQLAALSILQDGPGFPVFADAVVSYVTGHRDAAVNKEDIDDRIGSVIEQMSATSDLVQLRQLFSSIAIDALDVGFVVPSTSFRREHIALLEGAFAEDLVSSCREELAQFIEDLRTHDVLQMITSSAWPLLSGRLRPVTAAAVRSLLRFKYRHGNLRQGDQATAKAFLAFLQATKGTAATVNDIRLLPSDVLMWLTGATGIPAAGFHKLIDVEFGTHNRVNTCALVLTLAPVDLATPDEIVQYLVTSRKQCSIYA